MLRSALCENGDPDPSDSLIGGEIELSPASGVTLKSYWSAECGMDVERDGVTSTVTHDNDFYSGDSEKDCGQCWEGGNSSVLLIYSDFPNPTCPQKYQGDSEEAILKAAKEGDVHCIEFYQTECPERLLTVDGVGRNVLHIACWNGHLVLIRFLTCVLGSGVWATDDQHWSALHYACDSIHPQLDIVRYLVEEVKLDPRQETLQGNTPIVLAMFRKHSTIVSYLINIMDSLDPEGQRPALMIRKQNDIYPSLQHDDYANGDRDMSKLGQRPALVVRKQNDIYHSLQHKDYPNGDRDMSKLENRLFTFTMGPGSWPRAHPTERQLAEQGFMYLGQEGRVMCFCCKALVSKWNAGVDPLIAHYQANSSCQFLIGNFQVQLDHLLAQQVSHLYPQYSSNSIRLHSFLNWPNSSIVSSYKLASVGFYYLKKGFRVQCFSCGLIHEDWQRGDIPMEVHKKFSPTCQFIRDLEPRISPGASSLAQPRPRVAVSTPNPDYEKEENRVKSFKLLPKDFPVSRDQCAKAGLFFLRKPDVMQCFKCTAIVRNWVNGDIAVEKHREVSPDCKFLKEFFPTKLSQGAKEYVSIDPSSLPEPLYTREDLEKMAAVPSSQLHPLLAGLDSLSVQHLQPMPSPRNTSQQAVLSHISSTQLQKQCSKQPQPSKQLQPSEQGSSSSLHSSKLIPTRPSSISHKIEVSAMHPKDPYSQRGHKAPHGATASHPSATTSQIIAGPSSVRLSRFHSSLYVVCMHVVTIHIFLRVIILV